MYKYALVLSGGGFKGAFQAGALQYLKKNWQAITGETVPMKFDLVAGVSVGSLNGALVAMDRMDLLVRLWKEVGDNIETIFSSDFIDTRKGGDKLHMKLNIARLKERFIPNFKPDFRLRKILSAIFSQKKKEKLIASELSRAGEEFKKNFSSLRSIADNQPLKHLLTRYLDVKKIQKGTRFLCGSVSLTNGEYYAHAHTDFHCNQEFVKAVLASTAMPIVWEPVESVATRVNKPSHLVDGGLRNVSPLADVIDLINADPEEAPYKIFIINCNGGKVELQQHPEKMNIAEIALRSINDIALTEIFNNDLSEFLRINDLLKQIKEKELAIQLKNYNYDQMQRTDETLKYFESYIIQPDTGVLGDTLVSNPSLIRKRMRHGWEKAKSALEQKDFAYN